MIDICDVQDKTNIINKIAKSIGAVSSVNPVPTRNLMQSNQDKIVVNSITKGNYTVNIVFDIDNEKWFLSAEDRHQIGKKFNLNMPHEDFELKLHFVKILLE
jgi:hypothetical protein